MKIIINNNHNKMMGAITLFFLSLFIVSCGSNGDQSSTASTVSKEAEGASSSCYNKYTDNLDEMLTKEEILKHYKGNLDHAEMDYDTIMSSKYSSVMYSWNGNEDRTERIVLNGNDYGPKPYQIGIGSLDFYSEDEDFPIRKFKNTHHTMTKEDMEKASEAINRELNKVTDNEQTKKTSKTIGKSIISKIKFDPIEGVGDAAVWDYLDGALTLLKGRAIFSVTVDVSDDHAVDLALAKNLAMEVLAKCP